jgi:Helix-turn-helix domain
VNRHWRRDSVFGPGPRVPLDREQRARVLFLAGQHRRPGRLSAGGLQVLVALIRLLGSDGRLDPSHATLAALAKVHVATVQRALDRLHSLGLLAWQRRLRRDEGTGWRAEQTSSAYWLTPQNASLACDLQIARPVEVILKKKDRIEVAHVAPEAARGALAAIAARRMWQLGLA